MYTATLKYVITLLDKAFIFCMELISFTKIPYEKIIKEFGLGKRALIG
jgi:hypothetical protein